MGNHPTAAAVPDHVTVVPGDVLNPVSDVGVLGRETDTVGRGLGTADEKGQNPGINIGGLALSLVIGKVKGKRKNLVKKMSSKPEKSQVAEPGVKGWIQTIISKIRIKGAD